MITCFTDYSQINLMEETASNDGDDDDEVRVEGWETEEQ